MVDDELRLLILNARGPQDARSVLGLLSQPWEAEPTAIIVGVDSNNVEALWEALQRTSPAQLIVAGAPGDDDRWLAVERYCREQGIRISYLEHATEIVLPALTLVTIPPVTNGDRSTTSYTRVESGQITIGIGLGGLPDVGRFHLTASAEPPDGTLRSDLHVFLSRNQDDGGSIGLSTGDRINVTVDSDRLRISGRPANDFDGS